MTKEEALKAFRSYTVLNLMDNFTTDELQEMIDAIVSTPSLPSDIDEAAEEYFEQYNYMPKGFVVDAFKAGAEWMAGQGESFDTEMSWLDSFGFQIGWPEDTSIFDCFNPGDKVVVQIRKK